LSDTYDALHDLPSRPASPFSESDFASVQSSITVSDISAKAKLASLRGHRSNSDKELKSDEDICRALFKCVYALEQRSRIKVADVMKENEALKKKVAEMEQE
jgi:hypothetical protein